VGVKLHLGCSKLYPGPIKGWHNLDLRSWGEKKIILHDLRDPLPYEDGTVEACFTCHTLEHLTYQEAGNLLLECRRVMKQCCQIRVIVPDLDFIVKMYCQLTLGEIQRFAPHPPKKWKRRIDWLLEMLYPQSENASHRYMYTDETITDLFKSVGFAKIKRTSDRNAESEYAVFREIEDFPNKSLCLEAQKYG